MLSIGSGREVDLREREGVPLALVFHLQGTASEAVNQAVRESCIVGEVTVLSVIDLLRASSRNLLPRSTW